MNAQHVSESVVAWVRETIPELVSGYPFIPTMAEGALPDVVAEVEREAVLPEDPRFPQLRIQQVWIHVFDVGVSLMVDNSDPASAAETLRGYAEALTASLLRDVTLGGRVDFSSPFFDFDYTGPFVERPDGVRGRELTMTMAVGEPVEVG